MATKERLKETKKLVNDALKAEKQKDQFQAFVLLHKASDHCEQLLKEGSWQDKQRKELSKLKDKAAEGIQRITIKLTPDQLDAAMASCAPADVATAGSGPPGPGKPTSAHTTGGDARDLTVGSTIERRSAPPQAQPSIAPTSTYSKKPRVMLRAQHAWDESQGGNPDTDLFFSEGDVFELVSDTVPGYGWWTGFNDEGFMEGIFPANCTSTAVCALAHKR
jgi:hypothetical protein